MSEPELKDKKEIAKYFGRTTRWVEVQMHEGLPYIKLSHRTVRFRLSDIQEWMNSKLTKQ